MSLYMTATCPLLGLLLHSCPVSCYRMSLSGSPFDFRTVFLIACNCFSVVTLWAVHSAVLSTHQRSDLDLHQTHLHFKTCCPGEVDIPEIKLKCSLIHVCIGVDGNSMIHICNSSFNSMWLKRWAKGLGSALCYPVYMSTFPCLCHVWKDILFPVFERYIFKPCICYLPRICKAHIWPCFHRHTGLLSKPKHICRYHTNMTSRTANVNK